MKTLSITKIVSIVALVAGLFVGTVVVDAQTVTTTQVQNRSNNNRPTLVSTVSPDAVYMHTAYVSAVVRPADECKAETAKYGMRFGRGGKWFKTIPDIEVSDDGVITYKAKMLTSGATFSYQAFVEDCTGITYGSIKKFTTRVPKPVATTSVTTPAVTPTTPATTPEDAKAVADAQKAAEKAKKDADKAAADAAKQAEKDKKAADKKAEDDAKAAKKAADEATKKAAEDKKAADAAKKAEDEKKAADAKKASTDAKTTPVAPAKTTTPEKTTTPAVTPAPTTTQTSTTPETTTEKKGFFKWLLEGNDAK